MVYCNAAHCPPMVVATKSQQTGGRCRQLPNSGNMVVGFDDGMTFEEGELQLQHGDTLFLFTDGVSEAINTEMEEYGYQRLMASLEKTPDMTPQQVIEHVKEDLAAFVGEAEQSDDITMLALKRK